MKVLRDRLRPAGRLSVGPARPDEAPAIGDILSDWIDETDWMPRIHRRDEEQGFAAELVRRGWVSVARRGGAVQGFLARDGHEVVALYVARGARGQGVGRRLIERAQRRAARLELWTFQFNHAARSFYEGHGFIEVARTGGARNDEKLPDIKYLWEKRR
ncbi:GNAT family N-acetyltransferase [Sinisalibacter aestuarii]|uniref:N-acetyltransferase GCN5 n=1 Tax=Sinisalibacter aestuarii TaxID=2949426 RepID=A0ABQ5LRE5_9RHOB|nr:GNAT family N-acetyltransferase [Sinisalibacter aestuarii]GKY87298.1 N-acetyltransferase GCN5 [Sinisalibacter aestuarii]